MAIPYSRFYYIPPPQTGVLTGAQVLGQWEEQGWIAQIKRNGSNSVVFVTPDRQVFSWNRHNQPHNWSFGEENSALFRSLPGRRWWVFNGELMDHQTPHIKDTHYLHDVLVYDGELLTGTTYADRYTRLAYLWPILGETEAHYILGPYTWLARCHNKDFQSLFAGLTRPEDEGLMLKRPEGEWIGPNANLWMAKVRRPKRQKR